MSQTTPPTQGQIEAPNPLELFWEKNKRIVTFGVLAIVVAIAVNYVWQAIERREASVRWTEFAEASALDKGYAEPARGWSLYQQFMAQNPGILGQYLVAVETGLAAELGEDIETANAERLRQLADANDPRAPLALWVLAGRAIQEQEWEAAEQHLLELQQEHPDHFLTRETRFPVQWRDVQRDEEGKRPEPDRNRPPVLVEPAPGSAASRLLAAVRAEREFRQQHAELYSPIEPDSAETVVFDFGEVGEVKIKLFSSRVPEHTAKILELARADWWKGQRVHEIRREPEGGGMGQVAGEMRFGWPSTTTDQTSEWKAGDVAEEHLVPWEETVLSHFPFTVAVEPAKEGKSQVERLVINADDDARADGTRVIVGRVVEGEDVVREIIASNFPDEQAARQGRGRPEENITVQGVRVEE